MKKAAPGGSRARLKQQGGKPSASADVSEG